MARHNDVGKGTSKEGGGGVSWDLVEAIEAADISQRQQQELDASRGVQRRGLSERLAQAADVRNQRAQLKAARRARRHGGTYVKSLKKGK